MEGKFCEGERIVIKLNSGETFEGDYVKGTADRIDIENIEHHDTGSKVDSMWSFYRREIDCVYRLNVKKAQEIKENTEDSNLANKSENDILLPREEYERLKDVTKNYIYVRTDDKTYFDAVNQISNFESLGVFAIGSEKGRCGRISLIALSTWKENYIFDLKNFRTTHFPKEIAGILECYYIKKVVHNGGLIKDCLLHSHNISMNNVFDTQVCHLLVTKSTSGKCPELLKTIGECLTEYFNFPSSLLTSSMESLNEPWENRPLDENKLIKLSRMVTYLIPLKDHQMGLMLKNFDKAVVDYHNLYTKSKEFQLIKRSATIECTDDIDRIIPFELLKFTNTDIKESKDSIVSDK
ncbi:hypothetical protein HHI36_010174 [Cryptolaemus montrouzieri]|uniref:Uncharacterized protein n=1 Tax=Cryptolaemus montrouzieri TaxID=559131 RepID=A0ABD2MHZ5_9CUCU